MVSLRYQKNDWTISSPIVYSRAYQYIFPEIGFDASCIDKIIECPPQVDLNVWKY